MYSLTLIFIRFGRAVKASWKDSEFKGLVFLVCAILAAGTVVYHMLEGWRYIDSFYFSAMTLTTVGSGNFVPTHDATKIFTVVYVFLGVGIIIGFINTLAKHARTEPSVISALAKDANILE